MIKAIPGKLDADGNKIYDTNNIIRNTYSFKNTANNEAILYYQKQDAYGIEDSYIINWSDESSKKFGEYCTSFKWVESGTGTGKLIHGMVISVDDKNGSLELGLHFDDKGYTYDTSGIVKIRNSNVLENH